MVHSTNGPSPLSSCLHRKRREEVGPCDHVSHEERQIYQTSIPWCWISFASLRGRKQNNFRKKKKRPPSFLTNDNHLFYNASAGERAGPTERQEAGSGPLWRTNSLCESGLRTLKLWVLQDFDGRRRHVWGKKTTTERNVEVCTQPRCGLITCTLIIVYYDDDMTECTEDDWQLSLECWSLFFFFKLLSGNGCRMLKKSIIILIIMIIQVVLLPP